MRLITVRRALALVVLSLSLLPVYASPISQEMFLATAYSLHGRTASGTPVTRGIVAADPHVLKLGTKIHIDAPGDAFDGNYVVKDTGVRGRRIDIWVPSRKSAIKFGRQRVQVSRL